MNELVLIHMGSTLDFIMVGFPWLPVEVIGSTGPSVYHRFASGDDGFLDLQRTLFSAFDP